MIAVDIPRWHSQAKCARAKPGEYDYPSTKLTNDERKEFREWLKTACVGCPVIVQCAADALENPRFAYEVIRAGAVVTPSNTSRKSAKAHWEEVVKNGG